ncbi:DUF1045 domain-containing protein [Sulfitobacter mediterraneus]|uniref:DUF1045 domain-containing protein n=1 Tax=Sulfitobacter mediterraneus TaxID=83219 RepID=UPI0021A74985|nr:DUF1045 domain-containing protein [Sulfitobacter mediterraneus]UWR13485.1 DUF1045 domain-containing protein [Sulfitobacter mediterraneus]
MSAYARYAVYVVPQGDLGAAWLGWDVGEGGEVAQADGLDLDLPVLTQTPRRYGFHGTVMAPFQMREGATLEELRQAFAQLCSGIAAVRCGDLEVVALGRFVALIPQSGVADLRAMAAQVVEGLDQWRAPLPAAEFERRNRPGLSDVQRGYLQRWGYPHVMEAYRFHMTLTGRIPKAEVERVVEGARDYFAPLLADPMRIDDLALVGQRPDGRFEVIARCALQG